MPSPAPGMMGLGTQSPSPAQPNPPAGNISVDPSGSCSHLNYFSDNNPNSSR